MKDETPYQAALTSLLRVKLTAAKAKASPLFLKRHRKAVSKFQDDTRCTLLFGCNVKQLPKDLRKIVQDVFDRKRALDVRLSPKLDYVADQLNKRSKK